MVRWAVAFLILGSGLVPGATASALITGFAVDLPGGGDDDAFEIGNVGNESVALGEFTITDHEGRLGFPAGLTLAPGERVVVALEPDAYASAARRAPNLWPGAPDPAQRVTILKAGLRLAREADELVLERSDQRVDAVAWGSSDYAGVGWTGPPVEIAGNTTLRWFHREGDHDDASDWEHAQRWKLGWRAHDLPRLVVPGLATAYTAPEASRSVVFETVAQARSSLRMNVYEFLDVGLARALLARLEDPDPPAIKLLVDEAPVGLDAEERLLRNRILQDLGQAGAQVRLLRHERYNYNHAKYIVADDHVALVQSENFVSRGMPADGASGNRGWGVRIEDAALAQYLAGLFEADFQLDPFGARALGPRERSDVPLPVQPADPPPAAGPTETVRGLNVTLIAGPESNLAEDDAVRAVIAAAKNTIVVEQLALPPVWKDASGREWENAYLAALAEAARRGVHVRILLDGHFLGGGPLDNDRTVAWVKNAAAGLPMEARLVVDEAASVLHVKGMVVDGRYALVGSMNWNLNSVAQNREVDLLLEAPSLAAYYQRAFDQDWGRGTGVIDEPGGTSGASFAATLAACVLGVAAWRRGRTGCRK